MKASERNVQGTDERSIGGNVVAKVQVRPKTNKLAWIICFLYFCLFCILFSGRNNLFATYFHPLYKGQSQKVDLAYSSID